MDVAMKESSLLLQTAKRLMAPNLVSFFGPDGAGKSTQMRILVNQLRPAGLRVKKVWIRSPHTFAFIISRLLFRLGLYRVAVNPFGLGAKQPLVYHQSLTRGIWAFIETVSVLPLILLRVYLPLWLGYRLVAERYLVDTIVTISYFIRDENFLTGRAAHLLLLFVPKKSVFIFLDSDYATILGRRGQLAEPQEFIDFQRQAYHKIAKLIHAEVIDTGSLSIEQTCKRVFASVFSEAGK